MPKVTMQALEQVQSALDRYVAEVENSELSPSSKVTYIDHAWQFVRWLDDDFQPGSNIPRVRRKRRWA